MKQETVTRTIETKKQWITFWNALLARRGVVAYLPIIASGKNACAMADRVREIRCFPGLPAPRACSKCVGSSNRKWLAKPNVLGIHFVPWEGHPQGKPADAVAYARGLKELIGARPLWISG